MNIQDIKIDIGGEKVEICKLFGPMIFHNIRVYADTKDCCWVIERETFLPIPDPKEPNLTIQTIEWVEWCRIPGQFKWEFIKDQ